MLRLALRMLLGDAVKCAGVVMGMFFCTFLITHMLAMFSGAMQKSYALVSDLPHPDIWVMDPSVEYVDEPAGLSPTVLPRVRGVHGVHWAVELYTGGLRARLPGGRFRSVMVIGVDDDSLLGLPSDIEGGSPADLRRPDAVIVDEESARTLLRVPISPRPHEPGWNPPDLTAQTREMRVGDELTVNDHRVVVVGIAKTTPRFLARPIVYTTATRAEQLTPRQRNITSYVLVKAAPDHAPADLCRHIEAQTGLSARTAQRFKQDTYDYFLNSTGAASRILFMTGTAVVVGVCISALLLFMFTVDNARYYITFKALGTPARTLIAMVVTQALAAAFAGFGFGVGVSSVMGLTVKSPAMPYQLTWWILGASGSAVGLVTVVAAILSGRYVARLDMSRVFSQ